MKFEKDMKEGRGIIWLSEETLEWLEWYNSIPPEKQLAVNSIPAELYTDDGVGTVDADQEK